MAKTTVIFDKNGLPVTIDGVRAEYSPFFQLVYGITEQEIAEPVGWGEAERVLERDPDFHGFHYEYISADTPLLFTCNHGKDLITEVYEAKGGDGEIYLQYGLKDGVSIVVVEYEGRLNLNSYNSDEAGVSCQVERKSLHEVVKSRWNTALDLFSDKSLDETTISTITPKQLTLHSMAIRERYEKIYPPVNSTYKQDKIGPIQLLSPDDTKFYIVPNITNPTVNEIKTANDSQLLGVSTFIFNNSGQPVYYAFEFLSGGTFDVNLSWNVEFAFVISRKYLHGNHLIGDISYTGKITIAPLVGLTTSYTMSGSDTITIDARETGLQLFTGELTQSITVNAGDKLMIYLEIDAEFNPNYLKYVEFSTVQTNAFSLKVEGATKSSISAAKGLTLGEATLQALRVVTGLNDPLRAPFMGIIDHDTRTAGAAADYFVTNGFQLRKFDAVNRPLKPSLSELVDSADAIFAVGMQYDENNDGQFVKVMPAEDFYAGGEILYVTSNSEYKETADKEMPYNQIEIGFEKYIDDPVAIGNLDEYNTRHEYQTPIRTEVNKWSKLSKLVMSGYAIEQTRREQFADKPNDSTQFDDSNFLIAFIPGSGSSLTCPMSFNGLGDNNYIALGDDYIVPSWVVVGMALQVSGTFANNRVFTVTKIDVVNRRIWVLEDVNTSSLFLSATISSYNYIGKAEKDEAFDSVDHLFGSETAYNLRRTPKRMLITHMPFIASGLKRKEQTELIKSTFVKNNGLLQTQLKATDPYPLGDINFDTWTENESAALSKYQDGKRVFSPDRISFNCRLSKDLVNLIRRALLGKTGTGIDYGYISTNNLKGEKVSGYPLRLIYNVISEECKLILQKK